MCGIAGFMRADKPQYDTKTAINRMTAVLSHRGPDHQNSWENEEKNVVLGHTRLSILDLSANGNQPMHSHSRRYVLTFNGEIYNHLDLRKRIHFSNWRGTSDSETLIEAIDQWGVEDTLPKLTGMFAIAVYDKKLKKLFLARDRFGEKPLYYSLINNTVIFASELKSISAYPGLKHQLNHKAVEQFMKYGYIPTPLTIWKDVFKLPPGCLCEVHLEQISKSELVPKKYWDIIEEFSCKKLSDISENVMLMQLEETLTEAINSQMLADVPVGVFLSGGIDSSLIASIAQTISDKPINSFSVGFAENSFDESKFAKKIAHHLGTSHHEYVVSPKEALNVIPNLPNIYSEPFADSSQIPSYLVSNFAKSYVGVCLTGDGGDEIFSGYNRYVFAPQIWSKGQLLPKILRQHLAKFLINLSPNIPKNSFKYTPTRLRIPNFQDQLKKIGIILTCESISEVYDKLVSTDPDPGILLEKNEFCVTWGTLQLRALQNTNKSFSPSEIMMFRDITSYLCDDILTKLDRAAMSCSLETRVPILDHRVASLAWSLPNEMLMRDGVGKWALRKILNNYIPEGMTSRPKQGFAIPLSHWLRGPLRAWAEELLNPSAIKSQGIFDENFVNTRWNQHIDGKENCQNWLWSVLSFQSWEKDQDYSI